jgi:hypothetical protein
LKKIEEALLKTINMQNKNKNEKKNIEINSKKEIEINCKNDRNEISLENNLNK